LISFRGTTTIAYSYEKNEKTHKDWKRNSIWGEIKERTPYPERRAEQMSFLRRKIGCGKGESGKKRGAKGNEKSRSFDREGNEGRLDHLKKKEKIQCAKEKKAASDQEKWVRSVTQTGGNYKRRINAS